MAILEFSRSVDPLSSHLLESLNSRQKEAVLKTDGPLLVIAGAGAGKTKMLTTRMAHLVLSRKAYPSQILALTFTNKAAAEMKHRLERLLQAAQSSVLGTPDIGTFHSFCVRLLRRELAHTPFQRPFVIYDDSDQLSLMKRVVRKLQLDEKRYAPKGFQARINRAKCDALEPQDLDPPVTDLYGRKLKQVYELYQQELFAHGALDFGEILCLTYRLLRDQPELRARYQARYRFIHVDEYQDTNRAQFLILSLLAAPEHGGHQNLCVVGDEDQSIYKWRGADISNILDFEAQYRGAAVVKLEQNYRSTQVILKAAGKVIQNNEQRKDKTLWSDREEGAPVVLTQVADERVEAEWIFAEIQRLALKEGRAWKDFAIFYRTNAQSRPFEDVFRREKVPYQMVGGLRFYDRKEIKDLLAYLRCLLNPSDSVSLKRILNVPGRGIGKTSLDRLESLQDQTGASYWEVLRRVAQDPGLLSPLITKRVAPFVQMMEGWMQRRESLLLSELVYAILDETGYVRELRQEGTDESLARIENLEELDNLIREFEADLFEAPESVDESGSPVPRPAKSELLPLFIEQSALASDADGQSESAEGVRMMTLHASKGLEFPVVFLVGLEEGLFPSVKAWEQPSSEEIEEERRLCYVGMTRAQERLYLLHAVIRRIWGEVSYQEPSRFLSEVPESCLDLRDSAQRTSGPGSLPLRLGSSRQLGGASRHGNSGVSRGSEVSGSSGGPGHSASGAVSIGQALSHPIYGKGKVVSLEGSGADQKVQVEFVGRERKKFLLRYVSGYLQ